MRARLSRGLVVALVVALVAAVVGDTALDVVRIGRDVRAVEGLVDDAAEALRDGRLSDARRALGDAQARVARSNDALHTSLGLSALRVVPGASANLRVLQSSIDLAAVVIHGGRRILALSAPLESPDGTLEVSLSAGTVPLDAISAAQQEIAHLLAQLTEVRREKGSWTLLPPLREAHEAVLAEADERTHQLRVLHRGLGILQHLVGGDGPRRYLIAVANTAEMRGSGGMVLSYGVLEGRDGTVDLAAFGDIDELSVPGPVDEALVPSDVRDRWDGFGMLGRFRQANVAADFTVVAPVLEELYRSATRLPVDGVIQIDPSGLAAILAGIGPVEVPGLGVVGADDVVDLTLNEAYVRFPDVEERTEVLGDVAEAVFRRLVDGDFPSLRPLAEALVGAVDGRHLLFHATSPTLQAHLASFGADGALPDLDGPDAVALTAQNLSGNKLDYYLDTHLELAGVRPADRVGEVSATVTLANSAPPGVTQPRYIFGPGPGADPEPAGTLRSLVTLYLPLGASVADVAGDALVEPVASGTEAGRPYVTFTVDVPAGEARTVHLDLRLAPRPSGPYELLLVPSPRVRPTTARVDLDTGDGRVAGEVVLDRTWLVADGAGPEPVLAPIYRTSHDR